MSKTDGHADELAKVLAKAERQTLAVRAGQHRSAEGEHAEALFLTSSYIFSDCAEAAKRFSGDQEGNVYSRYTNPTVRIFEERLAALEGGEDCVATASGMSAIFALLFSCLSPGDHIVCSRSVFGSTITLLNQFLLRYGIEVTFVPLCDISAWREAIRSQTRLLFVESPSNPLNEIADISALSALAKEASAKLVVDNCFCSPALQQPLLLGADWIVHSATKYIDGQGRCLGGAVVGPMEAVAEVRSFVRSAGPSMSPFNAWVFLKGLETLSLRMKAHSDNALALAKWLTQQSWVEKVYYAGLPDHPQHALAVKQQTAFSGVLSFRVKGDLATCWRFIDATRLLSLTANLGDAKSTIVHPATTTHGRISAEARQAAGITDNLVRIAVGLEAVTDVQADLLQAAEQVY